MTHKLRNFLTSLLLPWLLTMSICVYAQAPTDEELKALEQQIEKKEAEQAEAKKRADAEAKHKAEEEAKKAELEKQRAEEEKRKTEEAKLAEQAMALKYLFPNTEFIGAFTNCLSCLGHPYLSSINLI